MTLSRLLGQQEWEHEVVARTFANIYYAPRTEMSPETAYLTALRHLMDLHKKVQTDKKDSFRLALDRPWKIEPFKRERK